MSRALSRVLGLALAMLAAALVVATIFSPSVMRLNPQIDYGLSLRDVLGVMIAGVSGTPATMLSVAAATALTLGAGLALAAWLGAGVVLVLDHWLTGLIRLAGLLTGANLLAWFGLASAWRLVAPWLPQGVDQKEVPPSADGTAGAVTGVDLGPLVWFALCFALLWLLLGLVRRTRAAVSDGLLLLATLATAGAFAATPIVVEGSGPTGNTVLAFQAPLLFGGGWMGMIAWVAVASLALQLALSGWMVAREPTGGRALRAGAAACGLVATLASVSFLIGLNLGYRSAVGTDSTLWSPYQPINTVLGLAIVLNLLALVLVFRRKAASPQVAGGHSSALVEGART